MKATESAAFARGVSAELLMESAGLAIARNIRDFFPDPGHALAVCGKGHNAGDTLVAARHLATAGWSVEIDFAFPETELSPLAAKKLSDLRAAPQSKIQNRKPKIVLDGLLGIGASGTPREPVAAAIRRIQSLRNKQGAFAVAVDIPSGLDADTGIPSDPCVTADLTVTIGHCKKGLVADSATNFVGRLALAALPELIADENADGSTLITPELLRPLLRPRSFDSHKGTWGRVGIVAGSPGFVGAARLCAEAALRSGAGLVTLYATPEIYGTLAATVSPEIMVMPVRGYLSALSHRLDAVGIGPGLGSQHGTEIRELVTRMTCPMVVDADALNQLARNPYSWQKMEGPRLFTPHPIELARLFRESMDIPRREAAEQYVAKHPVTLLFKGSRSIIAERKHPLLFNTTGNPGMGSGGMGDALTGVCASLMAAKHSPREAAMLGSWICGRAAELSVFRPGGSPESLTASDVIHHLGAAFEDLRTSASPF
jgi:hydroxyethylthiazole kinase-like uncharacterized protein yjeF